MDRERHARTDESTIRRLGELTKREIQVLLYLQLCRNARTGRCNPSRTSIAAGTGLHVQHVSTAKSGLASKGWIEETAAGVAFERTKSVHFDDGETNQIGSSDEPNRFEKRTKSVHPPRTKSVRETNQIGSQTNQIGSRIKGIEHTRTVKGTNKKPAGAAVSVKTAIEKVFDYYKTVHGKTAAFSLTDKRRKRIEARLKKYSVAAIFDAIEGCKRSPHHQGKNSTGTIYDDIELICRDDDHLETFIEIKGRRPITRDTFPVPVTDPPPPVVTFTPRPPPADIPAAARDLWQRLRAALKGRLTRDVFDSWFGPVVFDGVEADELRLRTNSVGVEWIKKYYSAAVGECLAGIGAAGYKIKWETEDETCDLKRTGTA